MKKKPLTVEIASVDFCDEYAHEFAFLEAKDRKIERDLTKLTAFVVLVAVFAVLVCLRVLRVF